MQFNIICIYLVLIHRVNVLLSAIRPVSTKLSLVKMRVIVLVLGFSLAFVFIFRTNVTGAIITRSTV